MNLIRRPAGLWVGPGRCDPCRSIVTSSTAHQPRTFVSWPLFATAIGVVLIGAGIWLAFGSDGDSCERQLDHPEWSVARHWNEATLNAIRRDIPAPTVHARNLFHGSAAMWDAWAAFDDSATGYFVNEAQSASDINAELWNRLRA